MKVAEVARRAGVGSHAVRFYVRAGLLRAERDPCNNYKQFGESHVLRLRFIKGAQSLGFSLSEIRALLARMDAGECTCDAMHLGLADKILELRQRIDDLVKRHGFMQRMYDDWRAGTDGLHDLGRLCRFLERQNPPELGAAAAAPVVLDRPGTPAGTLRPVQGASSHPSGKRTPKRDAGLLGQPLPAERKPKVGSPEQAARGLQHLLSRGWDAPNGPRRPRSGAADDRARFKEAETMERR